MTGESGSPARRRPASSGQVSPNFARLLGKYGASPKLMRKIKGITKKREAIPEAAIPEAAIPEKLTSVESRTVAAEEADPISGGILDFMRERLTAAGVLSRAASPYVRGAERPGSSGLALYEMKKFAAKVSIPAVEDALSRGVFPIPEKSPVFGDVLYRKLAEDEARESALGLPMVRARRRGRGHSLGEAMASIRPSLDQAGDVNGAVAALELVATNLAQALGPGHLGTLIARRLLGEARGEAGDVDGAILDLALVAADLEQVLGSSHPETLRSKETLARFVVPRVHLPR